MWFAPQRRALFRHLNFQKWSDTDVFCTSRHNGVHFFDTTTCKSAPCLLVFRAFFRHRNVKKWSEHVFFCNILTSKCVNVLPATTACTFSTSQLPKVLRTCQLLALLTSKCASCHNGVHFFDISTSKSGPRMMCLVHFDLDMCFQPQRRALFRHHNLQKCSDPGVLCTF